MIYLRELTSTDIVTINKWRNNRNLINSLGAIFRYINIETEVAWFDNYLNNRSNNIRCAICSEEFAEIIGVVYLLNIDFINSSAEFAIMIGDRNNQGKGIGTFATESILNHAFVDLNLNRVHLSVLEENMRAIRLYEKVGFSIDGVIREAVYKNGEYKNIVLMSILKRNYINK
ncbi:N-acetyltransferase [Robertmurraya yapensis]|uniref:N-acetyltransferase n=1 Tax=Bacillus yapensis TaxID=2492960 RepID=A0A3S0RU74_9BACI|nr:GNAT family protein [Bacillus yapensis]RTR36365.1 N-acetyltransferase [Bacillus yapensis]TKT05869.1 GNAT family N-acetyltransferase [Bacillus yapensis]